MRRIRILLADDHDLFRAGLASALSAYDDLALVGQASSAAAAPRLAAQARPDVVLLALTGGDGYAAIRELLETDGSLRVLALAVTPDASEIAAAVHAGACGYLLRDTEVSDVVTAIRCVAGGMAWLSPPATKMLLTRLRQGQLWFGGVGSAATTLSLRETEVLQLVSRGARNDEIAAQLSISPRTAKNHVASILDKLGVENRIQAAVYAVRNGIA